LPDGNQLVVWIRQSADGAQLVAQEISRDGTTGELQVVAKGTARSIGYPHLEQSGATYVLTWGGTTEQPNVRTAVLEVGQ
jgi:hypothetical protein